MTAGSSSEDLLAALTEALRRNDARPSLAELGGPDLLVHNRERLLTHDALPALVELLCRDDDALAENDVHEFLITAAAEAAEPIGMEEVTEAFLEHPHAAAILGEDLVDAWLDLSRDHLNLIGGIALEASARIVLAGAASPYGILDRIRRLSRDPSRVDDNYALRAVRVAGALAEHHDVPEIRTLLAKLFERDDVAEDAAFELGMLDLRQALTTDTLSAARTLLLEARRHFGDAYLDEERPDAAAFAAAVDAILAYSLDAPVDSANKTALNEAITELRLNLYRVPMGWRSPRLNTLSAWQGLIDALERAQSADTPGQWLHAAAIINSLVDVYTAHRTLDLLGRADSATIPDAPGLHQLLAPRVERTLLAREGAIALLDQWLEELGTDLQRDQDPATPLVREQAEHLRAALQEQGGTPPPKPESPAASLAGLGLSPQDTTRLSELLQQTPELADRLAAMNEAHQAGQLIDEVPLVAAVYRDTRAQLRSQCPDGYNGQFAADIDRMLLLLLRFLDLRLSETQKYGGTARAYLRKLRKDDERPLENDLGKDLRDFLRGQGLRVQLEVTNVGGGRVDIAWQPHDELITLELKRDWEDPAWDKYADKYLPQAISYQVAGPPINFLVVLDLTEKPDGLAAIPACVQVRTVPGPAADPRPRTVVMIRIQGNKRDPSSL